MTDPSPWPPPRLAPPGNLEPDQIVSFLRGDFESLWDAAEQRDDLDSRGNFTFASIAMTFLELCSRTACSDSSGQTLRKLSQELANEDHRYFHPLPGSVPLPIASEFTLPHASDRPADRQLLALLYDLVRHGLVHQYQQIPVTLADGQRLEVALAGPSRGRSLDALRSRISPIEHLSLERKTGGNLWMGLCPGALYVHLDRAARRAGVFSYGLAHAYLERPRRRGYEFSADQLLEELGPADN